VCFETDRARSLIGQMGNGMTIAHAVDSDRYRGQARELQSGDLRPGEDDTRTMDCPATRQIRIGVAMEGRTPNQRREAHLDRFDIGNIIVTQDLPTFPALFLLQRMLDRSHSFLRVLAFRMARLAGPLHASPHPQ
jgi:hypothetical protein